ncbi:MAG: tyramine oxidase, partial [Vicinamibacterales bacterium]
GEPDPMHRWRNYFDAGEVGLGWTANSLALGCDCVGEITYLDGHFYHGDSVHTIPHAICIHEEDAGTLWKHTDAATGEVERRRDRRLVLNSMSTVGNYEYAFRWYLHLDGHIDVEVELHGIVSTMAVADGEVPASSNIVDRGLAAPHHQHLFCFRLDIDIDGSNNTVSEIDSFSVPVSEANPWGNAFASRATVLDKESNARRQSDGGRSRSWRIESTTSRNALGQPTGYHLRPGGGNATLLAQPESVIAQRAAFARHTLWVTPYSEDERYPAGKYPYQDGGSDGLAVWTASDRPLEERDVVLWYTAGITHFVKPEDWPIMPVHKVGFTLDPVGFFDRNPTLDLPSPDASGGHCCHA